MAPKELLGVFVRLGGLVFFVLALFDCYYVAVKIFGIPTSSHAPLSTDIAVAIFYGALGLATLRGARYIVYFAYWVGKND